MLSPYWRSKKVYIVWALNSNRDNNTLINNRELPTSWDETNFICQIFWSTRKSMIFNYARCNQISQRDLRFIWKQFDVSAPRKDFCHWSGICGMRKIRFYRNDNNCRGSISKFSRKWSTTGISHAHTYLSLTIARWIHSEDVLRSSFHPNH